MVNHMYITVSSLHWYQRAKASLQRAKELNPMVQVTADSTDVESKPPTFFNDFDVVIATGCSSDTIVSSNLNSYNK